MASRFFVLTVFFALLFLAACGGGGGSVSETVPPCPFAEQMRNDEGQCEFPACPFAQQVRNDEGQCEFPACPFAQQVRNSEGQCGFSRCPLFRFGQYRNADGICECPSIAEYPGYACHASVLLRSEPTECASNPDGAVCRRHREWETSYGSLMSNYDPIAELGLSGRGVTIGVRDGGPVYWTNSEGKVVTHPDLPSIRLVPSVPPPVTLGPSTLGHGLGVLGVLAAQPNGEYIRGLAPDADYVYAEGTRSPHDGKLDVHEFIAEGVEIINTSSGFHRYPDDSKLVVRDHQTGEVDYNATRDKYLALPENIRVLEELTASGIFQASIAAADRAILVYAAGNYEHALLPAYPAHVPLYFSETRDHMLAVTGINYPHGSAGKYYFPTYSFASCGRDGAEYCITAPIVSGGRSDKKWLLHPDGIRGGGGGTSTAAPLVVGALALMKEYFRRMCNDPGGAGCGLGSHELVARIKDTADKSGIYADEEIYGAGLLDLENALTAQGTLMMRMGESLEGSRGFVLAESGLAAGGAFGDAMRLALGGQTLAAFDKYNAPFPVMSDAVLTEAVDDGRELGEVLRARQAGEVAPALAGLEWDDGAAWFSLNAPGDANFGTGFGFRRKGSNFLSGESRNPYAALAGNGIVAGGALRLNNNGTFRAAMFGENIRDETRTRGALMEWSVTPVINAPVGGCTPDRNDPTPLNFLPDVRLSDVRAGAENFAGVEGSGRGCNLRPAQWSFQLGAVEELDGMLRSSGSGVFGALRARTTFAGIHWRSPGMFNNWRMRIAAHAGRTSSGSGTWLSATERLWSGSYALGLERGNVLSVGDSLGFRLRQPLRTEGGFRMRVPTGRTKYGELTWREVSGEPSGRELEFEARYGRRTADGSWWMSAGVVEDAGHDASAKTEGRGLVGFEGVF